MRIQELFAVDGKVVLVTGGATGIGKMIAAGFVANGATVVISARNRERCHLAAEELRQLGECTSLPADVTEEHDREALVDAVTAAHGRLDVLVNNAGVARNVDVDEFTTEMWELVLDTNLAAPFFLTTSFLPLLRATATPGSPSRVINIGSNDGLRTPKPIQNGYAYGSSKAGLHHLTRTLALRLGPEHITVNAVAPGPFPSEMMRSTLESYQALIEDACPLRRIGRPSDMAGVALFLASEAGAYVTGAVVPVDGGNTIA